MRNEAEGMDQPTGFHHCACCLRVAVAAFGMHFPPLSIVLVVAQAKHVANIVRMRDFFARIKSHAVIFGVHVQRVVAIFEILLGIGFQSPSERQMRGPPGKPG